MRRSADSISARVTTAACMETGLALYASLITVMPSADTKICMRMAVNSAEPSAVATLSRATPRYNADGRRGKRVVDVVAAGNRERDAHPARCH